MSWWALIPFFDDCMKWAASTHLDSGTCERSITVPMVTLNGFRQSLHL